MKHTLLLTTLILPLSFCAHATNEERQLTRDIDPLIAKTIANVETSSFAPAQKQTLLESLSTIQQEHNSFTKTQEGPSIAQLDAALKALHALAIEQHKDTLRAIDESETGNASRINGSLLQSAKKVLTQSIQTHVQCLQRHQQRANE